MTQNYKILIFPRMDIYCIEKVRRSDKWIVLRQRWCSAMSAQFTENNFAVDDS